MSRHASLQLARRGATSEEVVDAIQGSDWEAAGGGRWECRRTYAYRQEWNGTFYEFKQVRPIFVEEMMEIVVVTVYVYYF